jgi:hypothetical protein
MCEQNVKILSQFNPFQKFTTYLTNIYFHRRHTSVPRCHKYVVVLSSIIVVLLLQTQG